MSKKSYRIIHNNKLFKNDNKEINTNKYFYYYKYFCYLSAKIIPQNQDCDSDSEKSMKY